jgi:hypothetical protein
MPLYPQDILSPDIRRRMFSLHVKNRNYLSTEIKDLSFQASFGNIICYFRNYFVGMSFIIADTGNTESSDLPGIIIADFGDRDVEFVLYSGRDGFEHAALVFKRTVLRDPKPDCTNTDVHGVPDSPNIHAGSCKVKVTVYHSCLLQTLHRNQCHHFLTMPAYRQ